MIYIIFKRRLDFGFTIFFFLVTTFFIWAPYIQNLSNGKDNVFAQNSNVLKVVLDVVFYEKNGFYELIKVLPDDKSDESRIISTILQKNFHYPTFVKIYFLRKYENNSMRSHIKVADFPHLSLANLLLYV
jgi:hypothetical protein